MKICVISYHSSPLEKVGSGNSGGMSIYLCNLYRKLCRINTVDIFTTAEGKKKINTCNVIELDNLNLEDFVEKVSVAHEREDYDIIHTHYWLSGLVGLRLKERFSSIPWIHSFHTIELLKDRIRDTARVEAEEEIVRKCDLVISPTGREERFIKSINENTAVKVIPHGVSTEQFTFERDGSNNLLFVGRIEPVKGLDILMESLKYMEDEFSIDIVGGAAKEPGYLKEIKSGAEGYPIHFRGRVPHEKLQEFYKNSSMLIVPSHYESFGLVNLESMAAGRPVVGFEDTGLSEVVGNKCGILTQRNPRELARSIKYLLRNKSKRYELGKNGRMRALKQKWSIIARRYLNVYGEFS